MADKLDFNDIIRRKDGGQQPKERALPSELYQCVIFYGRPIIEEVEEVQRLKKISDFKVKGEFLFGKDSALNVFRKTCGEIFAEIENQRFIFPFYSKEIFFSQQEAQNFLPIFIKRLIKEEKLPPEVINDDTSVNEEVVKLGVAPLTLTMLETVRDEFKDS